MDQHILEFFRPATAGSQTGNNGPFRDVVALHGSPHIDRTLWKERLPSSSHGWLELVSLPSSDRLEFSKAFWEMTLPFHPRLELFLDSFFSVLDDIVLFATLSLHDNLWEPHLVYSLEKNGGFFHGSPPATKGEIAELKEQFPHCTFPEDYLAFLKVHNGFCRTTDLTGIIQTRQMRAFYDAFQKSANEGFPLTTRGGKVVDPARLIPFYESFGMPFFQCFWMEWYPSREMGNIYYCGDSKTILETSDEGGNPETLSFDTFLDWLIFYLEPVC